MATQSTPLQRPLAVMMRRTMRTVNPDTTLLAAATLMRDAKVGALLVQEAGHYSGIVSEADLVRKGMAESCPAHETLVRAVMSSPLLSIEITSSAHEASDKMAEHGDSASGNLRGGADRRDDLRPRSLTLLQKLGRSVIVRALWAVPDRLPTLCHVSAWVS